MMPAFYPSYTLWNPLGIPTATRDKCLMRYGVEIESYRGSTSARSVEQKKRCRFQSSVASLECRGQFYAGTMQQNRDLEL